MCIHDFHEFFSGKVVITNGPNMINVKFGFVVDLQIFGEVACVSSRRMPPLTYQEYEIFFLSFS